MMHFTLAQEWLHREFLTKPNSTQAADSDNLFMFILWVCIISFVVLMGAMFWFVVKYRRRPGVPTQISPSHNTTIELAWSIGPLLILVPIFFWGFHGYIGKQAAPANSEIIRVTGKKWNWTVAYDNGGAPVELPKLATGTPVPVIYVPAGRPIKIIFTSLDVIHAFYIPDFRTKIDVIPNRYTSMWFQALDPNPERVGPDGQVVKDKDGNIQYVDHYVFCAEYCGENHSDMWAYIRVLSEADYRKKKEEITGPPKGLDTVGRGKFYATQLGCTNCHRVDPKMPAGSAPDWSRMWLQTEQFANHDPIDLSDDLVFHNYVRESVFNPGSKIVKGYSNAMSNFTGLVSLAQLEDLIAFMKTLSPKYVAPPPPADSGTPPPPAGGTPPAGTGTPAKPGG